jgi:hypothetical protein
VLLASAFGIWVSVARLRATLGAMSLEPAQLEAWVKRRGRSRVEALARAASRERDERGELLPELALALALVEPEARRRAGLCNEALVEIDSELSRSEAAPAAALRVVIFSTILGVVLAALGGERIGPIALDVIALGGGATLVVLAAGREATRVASERRKAIDGWISRSLEALGAAPSVELPGRPRAGSRTKVSGADDP